ncbi:MAG: hypothetical protein M0P19_04700 [Nevskia sp.]|jgi:Cu-Zn family superoxide dismutase|nr:hypothetical protein [Nevskia sp.]MCK9385510.1 hypothetical protein [Nevskia sp.]
MDKLIRNIGFSFVAALSVLPFTSSAHKDRDTIPLLGSALFPESIDYRAARQTFYVTGFNDGSIQTVTRHGGQASILQPSGTDGRTAALGIKVDAAHGRLWVLDPGAIYTYDLRTNRLLKKTKLSDVIPVPASLLNDLAIDRFGNAYVTDSTNPYIYRVDGKTLQARVWLDVSQTVPYGQQNGVPFNLNGIAITPNERYLVIAKTNDGTFWRVNLFNKAITAIQLPEALTFADGITWGDDGSLFVMRNFINTITKVKFSSDFAAGTATPVTATNIEVPTSAAYVNGNLYVVNSEFDHFPGFGGDGVANLPFTLSIVKN